MTLDRFARCPRTVTLHSVIPVQCQFSVSATENTELIPTMADCIYIPRWTFLWCIEKEKFWDYV